MVTIGVDSHKRTHTLVAVDDVGKKLAERTLAATSEGHLDALAWAERWPERRSAIEDCRHLTRRLESDLLAAGEAVLRVPPRLMAAERRGGREQGKSDPIDALAVARVALREPGLPVARLDGPARELKLLIDHREDLVRERVRMQARLAPARAVPRLRHPVPGAAARASLRRARRAPRRRRRDGGPYRPRTRPRHPGADQQGERARA
jgi:transposase